MDGFASPLRTKQHISNTSLGPSHSTPVKGSPRNGRVDGSSSLPHSAPPTRHVRPQHSSSALSGIRKNLNASLNACQTLPSDRRALGSHQAEDGLARNGAERWGIGDCSAVLSPGKQAKLADYENTTIQKQRQELQLMIAELRDRDRELNDMVAAHQKQMAAWEQDRQKILTLEERCNKLERQIQTKNAQIRDVEAHLRIAKSEDYNKSTALNSTQEQLSFMAEQQSQASLQLQELELKNRSLSTSLKDLSSTMGQWEIREQELLTVIKLKDKDLAESSGHISDLRDKVRKLEGQLKELRDNDCDVRRQSSDWRNKYLDQQREVQYVKKLLNRSEQKTDNQNLDNMKLRQELSTSRKEVTLATEREKRKDQLLDLQRSKQERTDTELTNVRQLYETQQRDLAMLHFNLESTKELLHKHQEDATWSMNRSEGQSSPYGQHRYRSHSHVHSSPRYAMTSLFLDDPPCENESEAPSSHTTSRHDGDPAYHISPTEDEKEAATSGELKDNDDQLVATPSECEGSVSVTSLDSGREEERATTPANENVVPSQVSAIQKSLRQVTESPATQLHKLLTESRDMVEELEKTVVAKGNGVAEEEIQAGGAIDCQEVSPRSDSASSPSVDRGDH